jgi:hypothetical protein
VHVFVKKFDFFGFVLRQRNKMPSGLPAMPKPTFRGKSKT